MFDFYGMRGFKFPGEAGGVNAAIAQHDWLHVLADYGTTPLGEIEVSSFQNAASRTPGAVLGLVGVLALFESGLMPREAARARPEGPCAGRDRCSRPHGRGHRPGQSMPESLLLDVDFFKYASEPLEGLRTQFGIPPKSRETRERDPYGATKLPPAA